MNHIDYLTMYPYVCSYQRTSKRRQGGDSLFTGSPGGKPPRKNLFGTKTGGNRARSEVIQAYVVKKIKEKKRNLERHGEEIKK